MLKTTVPIYQFKATDILPFTERGQEEKHHLDQFYQNFLLQRDELTNILQAADQFQECVGIHIYCAMIFVLSQGTHGIKAGEKYFVRLQNFKTNLKNKLTTNTSPEDIERELLLIDAVLHGANNQLSLAIEIYMIVLEKWPRDILAGLMIEFHCFEQGTADRQLHAWEKVKPFYISGDNLKDLPEVNHYLTSLAYAYELNNIPDKAILYANMAIKLSPSNPWTLHTLAHAYGAKGQSKKAIGLLEEHANEWNEYGDFVRGHNYFHLALAYLRQKRFADAYKIYEQYIKRNNPHMIYQQTDMVIFLWQVDICSDLPKDIREKLELELQDLFKNEHVQKMLQKKHFFPFLSLTYFYLSIRNHDKQSQEIILKNMQPWNEHDQKNWELGRQFAQAMISFYGEDYNEAASLLSDTCNKSEIGGSDEQREIFSLIKIDSLKKSSESARATNSYNRRF